MPTADCLTRANDIVDFLPWLWVWIMPPMDLMSFQAISLVAFVMSLVGIVIQCTLWKTGKIKIFPKMLEMGNAITFGAQFLLATQFREEALKDWEDCLQNLAIFLLIALPLLCDRPFTTDFLKEKLPEHLWDDPAFKNGNAAITFIWALALMAMTVASAVEPALKAEHYVTPIWITIVFGYILQIIPLGLAVKYSIGYMQDNRDEVDRLRAAAAGQKTGGAYQTVDGQSTVGAGAGEHGQVARTSSGGQEGGFI